MPNRRRCRISDRSAGWPTVWPPATLPHMALHALRRRFVDAPDSWGARRRARRWLWFADKFPDLRDMTVLDLGGRIDTWERAPFHPKHVHIVNLEGEQIGDGNGVPEW